MTEQEQRDRVVAEARTWLRTPYQHQGRIKNVGVDCLMILCEVYRAAGLVPYIDPRPYPRDWHLHRSEERYANGLFQYAHAVEVPKQGDVAIFKFGRCFSHAAILTGETEVIHSYLGQGVVMADLQQDPLAGRAVKFFSMWA
jgi:NlpC/P60 family putative phage cell wall peptidase